MVPSAIKRLAYRVLPNLDLLSTMASDSEPDDDGLDVEDEAEEYEQDLEDEPDVAQDDATEDGDEVCTWS